MSVIRAFIAIDFPLIIHQRLHKVSQQLRDAMRGLPIRWIPVENIHLTLKFLGEVSANHANMLTDMLQAEANQRFPFELSIGSLGAYPSTSRPRVIWVGIEAPSELATLQSAIEQGAARLGYPPESRGFSPHLTLGRVGKNVSVSEIHQISDALYNVKVGFLGAVRVDQIHLVRSDLRPSGAVYSHIFSVHLVEKDQ